MKKLVTLASFVAIAFFGMPAFGQGAECSSGLCGTPNQSGGGGCGCGCGCGSILVAMTDRGDTYQFADDFDGDGIEDEFDNCPFMSNYAQIDGDADTVGDACDVCLSDADPAQSNIDGDSFGDMCDIDMDGDEVNNAIDNCTMMPNADQVNTDNDLEGDACDNDDDNDGIPDIDDGCRLGEENGCDDDADGDGVPGSTDNCPGIFNPQLDGDGQQFDIDGDGIGDMCDTDRDGDQIPNFTDNCMNVSNPSQLDVDMDGVGDAGNWTGGDESCDPSECYVIGGDGANCLDPNSAFAIYMTLVGERVNDRLQVGSDITVALFSNRLGQQHSWTARLQDAPGGSNISLHNAQASGATTLTNPHVTNNLGNVNFTPDQPGEYIIKITASLPGDDALGPNTASYTIVAEVEGEAQGGCTATGTSAGLAALALGLIALVRRKK